MHTNIRSSDGDYKVLTCGSVTLTSVRGVSNLGSSRYITTSLLLGIVARDEGKVEMSLTAAQ